MKAKHKIKRSDYNRILVTETLPFETPIIFSNDGLYDRIKEIESTGAVQRTITEALVLGEGHPSSVNSTIPYNYKIKKNFVEFRRLSLLHPLSQWQIKNFYQKYERLILHYCSEGVGSIRSPQSIAGSFYNKSSWEKINQYKNGNVSLSSLDRYSKHAPSYFSYRGYDRLYKFFNSKDYFSLEKRFAVLVTLDVSKCFDSIYTHCLSWAVKDKRFTKQNVAVSSTFGQDFDAVIRHGNHNETNGIPIGPEVSRIFAEILFQEIDKRVIARLSNRTFGIHYTFRRYVDDVFIFADNDKEAKLVYDTYSDILVSFNLHANIAKSLTFHRPFVTTKSRLIYEAGKQANDFFDKFLSQIGLNSLAPKPVFSRWRLTKSYIDSVKALCSYSEANYDEVASFLISVITERVKKLVNVTDEDVVGAEEPYLHSLEVLLDVLFFLYSVAPSVGASYKLSTSIILIFRFTKKYLCDQVATVSQRIYELSSTLLLDQCGKPHGEGVEGFIHLECLNIVLAIRELGDNYLLPEDVLDNLFIKNRNLTYFTIVSCLFYIRDHAQYERVRKGILNQVDQKLGKLSDILFDAEKAYLFLDMLSCPFVEQHTKARWIKDVYAVLQKGLPLSHEIDSFFHAAATTHWQVDWADVDLLNSLEKKELKQAYE
ncbi:antiviral reverse transcriptase Drt3b [Herbaspirillum sp. GCM10030257]|uniref:antiviral reverse transcriptase Drt3b n=1 Tax=Herbaspirillum sp. GCM10030257 TaxID=3273393 RepID=UPI0036232B08